MESHKELTREYQQRKPDEASLCSIPFSAIRSTVRALAFLAVLAGGGAVTSGCTSSCGHEISQTIDVAGAIIDMMRVKEYFEKNKDVLEDTSLSEILGHPDVVAGRFQEAQAQIVIANKSIRVLLDLDLEDMKLDPKQTAELEGYLRKLSDLQSIVGNGYIIGLSRVAKGYIPDALGGSADAVIAIQEFFFELKGLEEEAKKLLAKIKSASLTLSHEDRSTHDRRFENIRRLLLRHGYNECEFCRAGVFIACLRQGENGEYTRVMQRELRKSVNDGFDHIVRKGFYFGSIDGIYGDGTKKAVDEYLKLWDGNFYDDCAHTDINE